MLLFSTILNFSTVLLHKHWYHILMLLTRVEVTSAFNHLHSHIRIFALHFNRAPPPPPQDSSTDFTTDHPSNL